MLQSLSVVRITLFAAVGGKLAAVAVAITKRHSVVCPLNQRRPRKPEVYMRKGKVCEVCTTHYCICTLINSRHYSASFAYVFPS